MDNNDTRPCKFCKKTMYKNNGISVVSDFNWARKVFCNHNCRSSFNNRTYKERALKLLARKKKCNSCEQKKPLFEFSIKNGKRNIVCKICASEMRKVKIQWRTEEEKEMKKIRLLRKYMAGLDVSHSAIPESLEPYISLRVHLDP